MGKSSVRLTASLIAGCALMPGGSSELMGGEMVYMADAARFTDCMSDRSYPIAMEGDFQRMQRAYMERVSAPGGRLYVTFVGTLADRPGMEEGSGGAPTVVVSSFIDAWPNQSCARSRAHVDLVNTYWRITRLGDQAVVAGDGRREPHLLLREVDGERSFAATVGCNQLLGAYTVTGKRITFAPGAKTQMGCVPSLEALEQQLADMLIRTRGWEVYANTLQLVDETGNRIALFEAVQL